MEQPLFKATCSVCGGTGEGNVRTAAAEWDSNQEIAHTNPNVCRGILERKEKAIKEKP